MPRKKKTSVPQKKKATKKTPTKKVSLKDGSYLDSQLDVSTNFGSDPANVPLIASSDPNATLLACLQRLEESNKDIVRRIEHLERQNSVNSTPLSSPTRRLHVISGTHSSRFIITGGYTLSWYPNFPSLRAGNRGRCEQSLPCVGVKSRSRGRAHTSWSTHGYRDRHPTQPDDHDAVIPSLEAIRKSWDISQSVARILNHYEESAKQHTLQGKGHSGKKFGEI